MLQLGVAFTYIVEIPCAFLIVLPFRTTRSSLKFFKDFSPVHRLKYSDKLLLFRHGVAMLQALFQVMIILSGNYGFFNLLTLVLCVSILDDE